MSFLLISLVFFWMLFLPHRLAAKIIDDIERKTDLTASVAGGREISLFDGVTLSLHDVTLSRGDGQSVPIASVPTLRVVIGFARLFGQAASADDITLESPVFSFNTSNSTDEVSVNDNKSSVSERAKRPAQLKIVNGSMKFAGKGAAVAISDIDGTMSRDESGEVTGELRGLLNGQLTTLLLSIDNAGQLRGAGSPADITLSAGRNQLAFSGRMRRAGKLELDGRLLAGADSLQDFLSWAGLNITGVNQPGMLSLESAFSLNDNNARLSAVVASIGNINIKGEIAVSNNATRPNLKAILEVDQLQLGGDATNDGRQVPSLNDAWHETPMKFAGLKAFDGELSFSTAKLTAGGLQLGASKLDVVLADGRLSATLGSTAAAGGSIDGTLTIAHINDVPQFGATIKLSGVDAAQTFGPLIGFSVVAGPIDLDANITAQGDSEARIVSSLGGTINASLDNGRIDGVELAEVLDSKGEGWAFATGKLTEISDLALDATLADGIATLNHATLSGSGLKLKVTGEVDVLRRVLDLEVKPKLIGGEIKLPVTVQLTGDWDKPQVGIDVRPKAALQSIGDGALDETAKSVGKKAKKALKKLFGN